MKIRLVYSGELKATRRQPQPSEPNKRAAHKHEIRRVFHRQLKKLWETDPFLSKHRSYPDDYKVDYNPPTNEAQWARDDDLKVPLAGIVASHNHRENYTFVPLAWDRFFLTCDLNILLLRRDVSRGPLNSSDIDNQVKTLLDALRMPLERNEFVDPYITPSEHEIPFYCLLQNDNQVKRLSVEIDQFLGDIPTKKDESDNFAHAVIQAHLYPYSVSILNLSFGN